MSAFYCEKCEMWYVVEDSAREVNPQHLRDIFNDPDLDCGMDWITTEKATEAQPEQNTITPDGPQRTRIVIDRKKYYVRNEKEDENELVIVIEPKKGPTP